MAFGGPILAYEVPPKELAVVCRPLVACLTSLVVHPNIANNVLQTLVAIIYLWTSSPQEEIYPIGDTLVKHLRLGQQ